MLDQNSDDLKLYGDIQPFNFNVEKELVWSSKLFIYVKQQLFTLNKCFD